MRRGVAEERLEGCLRRGLLCLGRALHLEVSNDAASPAPILSKSIRCAWDICCSGLFPLDRSVTRHRC